MNWELKEVTAVTTEPLTIDEGKKHVRVDDSYEASALAELITVARTVCETITNRALATHEWDYFPEEFPGTDYIELPKPPLQSVSSFKYKDSTGTETTLTEGTDYIVDTDSEVGRVVLAYGETWPTYTAYPSNPITIRYTSGYTSIPEPIKSAMKLIIGHLWENRELSSEKALKEIPFSLDALLSNYKIYNF